MQIKKKTIAIAIETVNRWNTKNLRVSSLHCYARGEEKTYKSLTIQKRHGNSPKKIRTKQN